MRTRPTTIAVVTTLAALIMSNAACSSSDSDATGASGNGTSNTSAPASPAQGNLRNLAVKDFAEAIKQPGVVLIDVRTPAEFAEGHLAGAKNIDVRASTFSQQIASLDKTASYAVYCHSGNRSTTAGTMMLAAGFTKVINLTGGITAWTAAGNQVTTS